MRRYLIGSSFSVRFSYHKITAVKIPVICIYLTFKPSETIKIALYFIAGQTAADSHYVTYRLTDSFFMIYTQISVLSKQIVYEYCSDILIVLFFISHKNHLS